MLPCYPVAFSAEPKPFSPHIRIDWEKKVVEVDASVVLREGMLELLMCSPRTREHESILVSKARPRDLHQAMGLIGLEPGKPVRFDDATGGRLPPEGQVLALSVRYQKEGREVTHGVEEWLADPKGARLSAPPAWLFAGSMNLEDGRYAGDTEGTIVAVVDFPSAVITAAGLHSADNEQLWLRARTEAIPEKGTPVVLLIAEGEAAATRKR